MTKIKFPEKCTDDISALCKTIQYKNDKMFMDYMKLRHKYNVMDSISTAFGTAFGLLLICDIFILIGMGICKWADLIPRFDYPYVLMVFSIPTIMNLITAFIANRIYNLSSDKMEKMNKTFYDDLTSHDFVINKGDYDLCRSILFTNEDNFAKMYKYYESYQNAKELKDLMKEPDVDLRIKGRDNNKICITVLIKDKEYRKYLFAYKELNDFQNIIQSESIINLNYLDAYIDDLKAYAEDTHDDTSSKTENKKQKEKHNV